MTYWIIYIAYFMGLAYLAREDWKYYSIPIPHTLLFFSLTVFGNNLGTIIIGGLFALMFYFLRIFALGDAIVIIPTIALFGQCGISAVFGSLILINIIGLITGKKSLPYIPILLVTLVVVCLIYQINDLVQQDLHHWNY